MVKFRFAEEKISSGHVLDKIEEMIQETAFGIYDVSSWNPNVTLEYGISRGLGAKAFIAFNPEKTQRKDVPTDVRGYDRLQYTDFDELSDKVATLVTQELGRASRAKSRRERWSLEPGHLIWEASSEMKEAMGVR